MSDRLLVFVFEQPDPQRLDKFLVSCLPEFSRARLQGLITDGFVLVDGQPARKSGQMLHPGAQVQVRIPPAAPTDLLPEAIPLDIIFENDDLMVVNKPAGMVVHPAAGHASGTLVHAALAHAPEMAGIGGEKRPGVVHRLDKDTSGMILLAKNDAPITGCRINSACARRKKSTWHWWMATRPPPKGGSRRPSGATPRQRKLMGVTEREQRPRSDQRILHPADIPQAYAAGSASAHRAHAPDPRAPGFYRLPGRWGYGLWSPPAIGAAQPPFFTCLALDHPPARRETAAHL